MTDKQKQIVTALVVALASRKPTQKQQKFITAFKQKKPNTFAWASRMAVKVRQNVDNYMLATWKDFS